VHPAKSFQCELPLTSRMGKPVTPARLLAGLDAIAASLAKRPAALALLGLGSCGLETERLDGFSDLDFFVIVEERAKAAFIADLDWLTPGAPIVFAHRNTPDGWKTLDEDGVLCEFAVFHPGELSHIPFAPGRVVWARDGFDTSVLTPKQVRQSVDLNWLATEALTNILVGLKRQMRGEDLAARRAILVDAADQVCQVMRAGGQSDPFNAWRRIEFDHPALAHEMAAILAHVDLRDSARGLVQALRQRTDLPSALSAEIQRHLDVANAR
jgi:hypothetical protein